MIPKADLTSSTQKTRQSLQGDPHLPRLASSLCPHFHTQTAPLCLMQGRGVEGREEGKKEGRRWLVGEAVGGGHPQKAPRPAVGAARTSEQSLSDHNGPFSRDNVHFVGAAYRCPGGPITRAKDRNRGEDPGSAGGRVMSTAHPECLLPQQPVLSAHSLLHPVPTAQCPVSAKLWQPLLSPDPFNPAWLQSRCHLRLLRPTDPWFLSSCFHHSLLGSGEQVSWSDPGSALAHPMEGDNSTVLDVLNPNQGLGS